MAVQEGTFSILANKVTFANKLTLLFKATADDESPTPGYMYQEIINISNESGSHCLDLLEVLVERLHENSCNVKLKVLRIMKHVVEKGHPDFTTALRKKSRGVQAATKHNGPPDPLHGNVPYLLVRKEAQALLSVLFEVKEDQHVMSNQNQQQKPMASISSVGIGSVDSSGSLRGFGNTPMKEKSLTESFISGLKDVAERVFDPHPLGREVKAREMQSFSNYKPLTLTSPVESPMENAASTWTEPELPRAPRPSRKKTPRAAGRAGGGWEEESVVLGAPAPRYQSPEALSQPAAMQLATEPGIGGQSAEEALVESWLAVDENTPPLPSRKEVEQFVNQCSTLNCDRIVMLLSDSLKSDSEPTLMRCLLAVERILHLDLVSADHISCTCTEHLSHLQRTHTGAAQSKARKILRILEKLCPETQQASEDKGDENTENNVRKSLTVEIPEEQEKKGLFDVSTPPLPDDLPKLNVLFAK